MKPNAQTTTDLIQNRRSIYPHSYNDKPVSKAIIQQMLENANWAPTHMLTEPWRFKVLSGQPLEQLGDFLADYYQKNMPPEKFSPLKMKKTAKKARQSAYVIAICMQRDPQERIREFEEICAVACAVQNMWLTAHANNLGAYWSTPAAIHSKEMNDFFKLNAGERCLGLFYIGNHDLPPFTSKRQPIEDKVVWME